MKSMMVCAALIGAAFLCSCAKNDTGAPANTAAVAPETGQPAGPPRATVTLQDGSKITGAVVASSQTDMVVDGADGIERKIPMAQVKSVEYGVAPVRPVVAQNAPPSAPPPPPSPVVPTSRTFVLAPGSEVSVRTNETIDSATAAEGQTFDAEVTRNAKDAEGDIVIPRGSRARIVIRSAEKGGKFHGASDLILDLQSVNIGGRAHSVSTVDLQEKGRDGVGANKRTAEFTGGGAALGAIIGAIAGGGKAAAIGAGAGAGAGALTQTVTKGGSIKIPAEAVLTFRLDRPLRVVAE